MYFTNPHSKQSSEDDLVSVPPPPDSLELFGVGASAGSSTLGTTSEYDQLYAWPYWIQMWLDPNFPTFETQSHDETGGDFNIQNATATGDQRNPTMVQRPRPVCVHCTKDFGRVSERNRHVRETHRHRRRCPFCDFMWAPSRPHKIKDHVMANHSERFTTEMLDELAALRGRRVIEFLGGYGHGLDMEATL